MNILHIYKDSYPILGEAQAARGHAVTGLVVNRARHTTVNTLSGVRVIKAARWATMASTPISPALFWQMERPKADVAHLHFPHPPGEVANWLFHPARRTVISYHSDVVRQASILRFYKPLMKRVLTRADAIIYGSPPMKNRVYLQSHQSKLHLSPCGIPRDRFLQEPVGIAPDPLIHRRRGAAVPVGGGVDRAAQAASAHAFTGSGRSVGHR
jgi:hypothetical protein